MAFSQDAANSGSSETLGLSMPTLATIRLTRNPTATSNRYPVLIVGMQQWGLNAGRSVNYLIPLTTLYCILAIDSTSDTDAVQVCNVYSANLSSAIIFQMRLAAGDVLPDNLTGFYWMLIGKAQQWGYNLATLGDGTTYNLLITCSDFNLGYISNNAGAGESCGCEATLTTIQLSRTTRSNTLCWATFGKQQWGSNFSTVTAETLVDYPIAVNNVLTILCSADQTDIHDAEYAGPGTVTTVNFVACTFALFSNTHALPYPYYWIMIGIAQQWGEYANGQGNKTVDLHISYVNYYLPFVSSNDTYNNNLPYVLPVGARPNSNLTKLDISSSSTRCYWLTIGI